MRLRGGVVFALLCAFVLFGCGTSRVSFNSTNGTATVSLSIRDTPPSGVTVLAFEITITGAVLEGSGATSNFNLVTSPIEIEMEKLETESAFLSTAHVPAGTYKDLVLTFANPDVTIQNNSGATVAGCVAGATCELKPALSPVSVTFSGPPFPLTLNANSPTGLLVDFDVLSSLQNDLSVNPTVTVTQLQSTGEREEGENDDDLEELEEVVGTVTAVDAMNSKFTLQTSSQSLTIQVNSATQFEDFGQVGCTTANFSCLKTGQIVEIDAMLTTGGVFVAKQVELEERENEEAVEGTVVSLDLANNKFNMVALEEAPDIPGVSAGNLLTVTLQAGAGFSVDTDDLTIPGDVAFASPLDLLVGQKVQVRPVSGVSGGALTTDRVRLKTSQITAKVESVSLPNFVLNNLPGLFATATPPIVEIQVRTQSRTEFEGVAGVASLLAGNTVSVRGLLFRGASMPVLVAAKVRKR